MLGRDPEMVAGKTVDRAVLARVWRFARPYRWMLASSSPRSCCASLVEILPPLLFRRIIDITPSPSRTSAAGQPAGHRWPSACALADAVPGRGPALVVGPHRRGPDLRPAVALFDHVQRMPLAFFTRTQTGALISRMNNDVDRRPAGAHRHARRSCPTSSTSRSPWS